MATYQSIKVRSERFDTVDMAIGFVKGAPVDKGGFVNAILTLDGQGYDAAAYIATDDDGNPVSLSIRVMLDDLSKSDLGTMSAAGIPVRGKTMWQWGSGETQPVGRKGSRWTVGGPRVTTVKRGRQVADVTPSDVKLTAAQKRTRTMLANMSDAERKAVLS